MAHRVQKCLRKYKIGKSWPRHPCLVALEVGNALRKFGLAREVKDAVDSIFSLEIAILNIDSSDIRNAVDIFHKHRISPYDCAHVAVMRHAKIRNIISADRNFEHALDIERKDPKLFV